MNFYLSFVIQMYPKYPYFWTFWSSQHSHRYGICPVLMFFPKSRSIFLLYRILSVYFSSFYQNKSTKINLCAHYYLTNKCTILVQLIFCDHTHHHVLSFYWELKIQHIQSIKEGFYGLFHSPNEHLLITWHPNVPKISSFLGILALLILP